MKTSVAPLLIRFTTAIQEVSGDSDLPALAVQTSQTEKDSGVCWSVLQRTPQKFTCSPLIVKTALAKNGSMKREKQDIFDGGLGGDSLPLSRFEEIDCLVRLSIPVETHGTPHGFYCHFF